MEQAERQGASSGATAASDETRAESRTEGVTRTQHVVYTLPHTVEALTQLLTPAIERIDPTQEGVQLVIVTADAETAVAVSDLVYRLAGPRGIEAVPVTSANRTARLLIDRPIHVVVGSPLELQTLLQRSVLKLASARTIVLAWADSILASSPENVAALETLFSELPKDTARLIVARQVTDDVEQLIERYARTARRVKPSKERDDDTAPPQVQYLVVSPTSRPAALRRLLDDLDPPSAAVVVRSDASRTDATATLTQLGYRRADDHVRVVDGAVDEGTHTVILYDTPLTRSELANVAEGAVTTIALLTPQELTPFRELTPFVTPLTLSGPADTARTRDRLVLHELGALLEHRVPTRELLALEPLLQQYDGSEIAAAALHLLERERAKAAVPAPQSRPSRDRETRADTRSDTRDNHDRWTDRDGESRPKRNFSDRPPRDFSDRPRRDFNDRPQREFSDRPKRDFGDRPKRDFGDRPKRDFGDRPKRDFNDRPKRSFGDRDDARGPRNFGNKRDFGDRPPKRDFGGKRDFNDRRKGNFGRDR